MHELLDALMVEAGKYALRAQQEHELWLASVPGQDAMRKALAEECCRSACEALNAAAESVFKAMCAELNLSRLDALMAEEAGK